MHPRLLTTPFFTVHTFGALLALAYLSALWWLRREAARTDLDAEAVTSLGFWAIVGAVIGAKVLMMARDAGQFAAAPSEIFSRSTLSAAGDFYGGFIGALVASAIFFRRHPDLPVWRVADLCGPAIALGQAIGRIGCLMAGDDYGRPTDVPWSVTFTDVDAARIGGAPLGVPLHPVQVYESFVCFVIFVVLVRLGRRKRFDGEVILTYTALYAIARFGLEFYRGDADRGFVLGGLLSTSQAIAAMLAPTAIALWIARRRARRSASSNRSRRVSARTK